MDKISLKASSIFNIFGGAVLLYGFTHCFFKVEPGYNAIKFNKITGVQNKVLKEGYHLMLPYFERPIIFDCKLSSRMFDVHCGTKGRANIF